MKTNHFTGIIVHAVIISCSGSIGNGSKETIIQAIPDLSLWLQAANGIECFDMRLQQITYHTLCAHQIMFAWWIAAKHISKRSVDVWFVDGNPEITEVV